MFESIVDFLEPLNLGRVSNDTGYKEGQIGKVIKVYEDEFPDLDNVDIVIVGCGEQRGAALLQPGTAADVIRNEFYNLYYWHQDIRLADIGNVKIGKANTDTYAALKVVLHEMMLEGKTVIVLGGSHDLTLSQYYAFADEKRQVDAVGVDAVIDINIDSPFRSDNYLMELLTADPNYMRHYNHIAFQSYFVHPRMLETMDKLRFDCFRVGTVKEHIDEMEPVIRNCQILSFDISALAHAFAPANNITPNGLNGEEACTLLQYAGMSSNMQSVGIYGYRPEKDVEQLTAKQISQMLWYFMDGRSRGSREAVIDERESFNEFHTAFAEVETTFLQSKKTGRWWMQLPDKQFIACSYKDYLLASSNEIPERWLRFQERP
ncbi:formimidoylglutamase [Flavisolibacter ginsengisoli]|jgi:arginase family enzyme|uniref:Arginase family enzyme n=1 Tax=Flavisolibacter ginsengisoli DSM 18119 TaxID=1121884 RepID=A0A1M4VM04_9BACT|nr:formimidoylglutamase [Flavisolibacter ginsengisoli]SHE70126.1 Arginase family enzyme [Flavisolibacter ginsengisoli DSM 18119]